MNRRLLLTGVALILAGALGVSPLVASWSVESFSQFVVAVPIVLSGLLAVLLHRRNAEGRLVTVFHRVLFATLAVTLIAAFIEMYSQAVNVRSYAFLHIASTMFISLGAPFLWGAALARRRNPGSPGAQKAGRLSAGAVQVGFVFLFAAELRMLERFGNFGRAGGSAESAVFALLQLANLAERIVILWASIECMRTAVDDEVIVRRAVRINRLMGGWLLLIGLSSILGHVHAHLLSSGSLSTSYPDRAGIDVYVWRSATYLLLTFAGALAEFYRLSVRTPGPDTVATSTPVSGAEA